MKKGEGDYHPSLQAHENTRVASTVTSPSRPGTLQFRLSSLRRFAAARGNLAIERLLDFFKRSPLGFRHQVVAEDPCRNREQRVQPKGSSWPESLHQRQKRQGNQQVSRPVRCRRNPLSQSTDFERIDF